MRSREINSGDFKIFVYFAIFWVVLAWLGFISALVGFFHAAVFIAYFTLAFLSILYFLKKRGGIKISSEFIFVVCLAIFVAVIFSSFTTPTIFSGRDQGAISEAAIRLSQNHQLEFSTPASEEFFKIYGPGKALNFPGFYYAENGMLTTQFPLPYIAWLSIFYSMSGSNGLIMANAVLLFIFLISFYLLARLFLKAMPSAIILILAITTFPFFWFFKFTLSENMALALIWLGILQIMLFLKEKNGIYFFSALPTFGLMAFTRIEGLVIFLMFAVVILSRSGARGYLKTNRLKNIIIPSIFLIAVFILNFFMNFPFFKEIGKASLNFLPRLKENYVGTDYYMLKIFIIYGIAHLIILGAIGAAYLLKKKDYDKLIPLIVVLPTFLYLFNSNISSDHPWMLRRYVFSIIPACILYAVIFFDCWLGKNKKSFLYAVLLILIFINVPVFAKYGFFSENKNLLAQTRDISLNFSNNDLVLVDRLASGGGWEMLTGPLGFFYGKQAVYFFNPEDFAKIDLSKFGKIYLIAPDENIDFYKKSPMGDNMEFYKDCTIKTKRLEIDNIGAKLPNVISVVIRNKIYKIN